MVGRARLCFLAALVIGAIVLATELPLGNIVRARAAVAKSTTELAALRSENRSLGEQVSELRQGSTIQQIAHQEYGLVLPGQKSIVVMPGGSSGARVHGHGSTGSTAPLNSNTIPKSDLVPTDSPLSPGKSSAKHGEGFWGKVVHRLEFWKPSS